MVDLNRVRKGRRKLPPRVLIFGMDGIGKTTFAAGAPGAFFLDANKGSSRLDVEGVDVNSWDETLEWTEAVASGQVKCETLVMDALSDFEAFSHAKLFPNSTVTKFEGGYGKGDDVVVAEWRRYLSLLERVYFSGKGIIIVSHARTKTFNDPTGPAFDRFELACRPQLAGMLRGWVDAVLFAREDVTLAKPKGDRQIATTTGVRYIYTRRTPAYDAKARGSLMFPEQLPLSWKAFAEAIENDAKATGGDLQKEMAAMLSEIADEEYAAKVREYVTSYPAGLVEAHNRVAAKLETVRKQREAA